MRKEKKTKTVTLLTISFLVALTLFFSPPTSAYSNSQVTLNITLIKTEPVPLQTGEYAEVWIKARNEGPLTSKDTVIELVPEFPFSTDPEEKLKKDLGKLLPGEEYHLHYQIRVDENAVQGENQLKFQYSSEEKITLTETVPVEVRTDDTSLLIDSVELATETGAIAPSKTEDLTVTLRNQADSYFKNVDISLDLSATTTPLITVGSTTRKRISKIAPGRSKSVTFQLKADSDADPDAYKVPITITYEDEAGNSYSESEYTGIIVGGRPELETNVVSTETKTPGTSGKVSISIVNRGLSIAKFTSIELLDSESYRIISSPRIYIGNMDPDDYESSDFTIYIQPGVETVELPLKISYKDSEGNSITEEQTVSFNTYTQAELGQMGLSNGSTFYLIVEVVGVIIPIYLLYRYWWKKRK